MKVAVVCFGVMREYLPPSSAGNRGDLDLDDGATAADAIEALGAPAHLVHLLLVDGARAEPSLRLHDGAEVTLMPPFTGGEII